MIQVARNKYGKLVSISDPEIKNGLKCECFCIDCGEPLIAKNNCVEKTDHFAHKSDYVCKGNLETYLHRISKQIIRENNAISLPGNEYFTYSKALIEYSIDDIRPDALLNGTKDVIIEIFVTNRKKFSYYQKIKALNIDAYEIDLSGLSYNTSLEEIKNYVLNKTDNKKKLSLDLPQQNLLEDTVQSEQEEKEAVKITPETNANYWPEVITTLIIMILLYFGFRKLNNKKQYL